MAKRFVDGDADVEQLSRAVSKVHACPECALLAPLQEMPGGVIHRMRCLEVCGAQRTPEWLEMRKTAVTASEAAAVLGQNPYETRAGVLRKKLGYVVFKGNAFTAHGQTMEAEAINRYETETGHRVESFGLLESPDEPYIKGSPDGITTCGILIEVKCPCTREIIPGEIPSHYEAQVQQLMFITGLTMCHFVQMKGPEDFHITNVPADPEWWSKHGTKLKAFHTQLHACIQDPSLLPRPRKRKKRVPKYDFGDLH